MIAKRIYQYTDFLRKCLALLANERRLYALFLVMSVAVALTEGAGVSMVAPLLDLQGHSTFGNVPVLGALTGGFLRLPLEQRIPAISGLLLVIIVSRGLLQYAVDALSALIPIRLQQRLGVESYRALMAVDLGYIQDSDIGHLTNGLSTFPLRVTQVLQSFANALWNSLVMLVYLGLMVAISWKMTLWAMVFVLVILLVLRAYSTGPLRRAGEGITKANSRLGAVVHETLNGMKLIRLSVAEALMSQRYTEASEAYRQSSSRVVKVTSASSPILTTGAGAFICLLLLGSALTHDSGDMSWVNSLILFLVVLFRLLTPVSQINLARNRMVSDMHAFEMLDKFREEIRQRRQPSGDIPFQGLQDAIRFEDVKFLYRGSERTALSAITTELPRGKMTAIVGPSGAGKSTIVSMVVRFFDPTEGRIVVDGADLRDLEISSWRRKISVVSQDIFIFNDSVTNNICFGREGITQEQVRQAAKMAAADEFIQNLPQGYDTHLGDRGVKLSGGQQQRIAIARAIIADPDIMIFDEATSHLDTLTERAIQDAIETLSKDRTLLVIAHRLSTIRKADKLIVMKDGQILEEGRHEDLIKSRGIYWQMIEQQRLDLVEENQD